MKTRLLHFVLLLAVACPAQGQSRIELEPVMLGLDQPLFFTHAGDGSGRSFILERPGRIRVLGPGATASTVFLDITARVLSGGEQGLLGLAFHPRFDSNGRFFVNYTRHPDGATVIAEYRMSADPNTADSSSENMLLTMAQPFPNHNGGMIGFGPDGFLYIATGDGGASHDPDNRAQNIEDLLGKILRIDVDIPDPSMERPYSAPSGNPFFGSPGRDEIFAVGFRNPWRFSFDRRTGQLYVADVGQNSREEVNIVTIGRNYGWRVFEGTLCTSLEPAACARSDLIPPVAEYENTGFGGRCSITGGYVYRGSQESLPAGAYVYGDFCSGEILMLKDGVQTVLQDSDLSISSFGEDESGELYVVGLEGSIYRITNPDVAPLSMTSFDTAQPGGFSIATSGQWPSLRTGYARIQADDGVALPTGLAILAFMQNGIVVSEAAIPASELIAGGRIYAESRLSVNTGVAIANPNAGPAAISYFFMDVHGNGFGHGTMEIPPNGQIAAFLNEEPFRPPGVSPDAPLNGTFTFTSSLLVSVAAVRSVTNERSDFLMASLPILETADSSFHALTIPHFADGDGWSTRVVLVNTAEEPAGGTLRLLEPSGRLIVSLPYGIAPGAIFEIETGGTGDILQVGSIRILPDPGAVVPVGMAILAQKKNGVTVGQGVVPAVEGAAAFRAYIETSSVLRPALAIANPSPVAVDVALEVIPLDGTAAEWTATISIPADGQKAVFLDEIPEFGPVSAPFQGVLRISSSEAGRAVVAVMRCRVNERGDFLFTGLPVVDESAPVTSSELLFPHLADGDRFAMQMSLFSGHAGPLHTGTVYFFDRTGNPLPLFFRRK